MSKIYLNRIRGKLFREWGVGSREWGFCMKEFIEQRIITAVRKLLSERVNQILHDEEFDMPFVEFGDYGGSSAAVVPAITLVGCEKSEKERIVRLAAYSVIITFSLPETFEVESHCYGIVAAVGMALKENPTLGGVVDRAVITGEKYVPPKKPNCGEKWDVVISLRVTVEE